MEHASLQSTFAIMDQYHNRRVHSDKPNFLDNSNENQSSPNEGNSESCDTKLDDADSIFPSVRARLKYLFPCNDPNDLSEILKGVLSSNKVYDDSTNAPKPPVNAASPDSLNASGAGKLISCDRKENVPEVAVRRFPNLALIDRNRIVKEMGLNPMI